MRIVPTLLVTGALLLGSAAYLGCDKDDPQTQKAEQKARDAAHSAGDAIKSTGEAIKEGAKPALDATERGAEKAGAAIKEGAEVVKDKIHDATAPTTRP